MIPDLTLTTISGSGRESHHRLTYRDETKQRLCYNEPIKMNTIVQNNLWLSSVPAYYQYSCILYLILDVVAMTDVRAKKMTKQDDKGDPACNAPDTRAITIRPLRSDVRKKKRCNGSCQALSSLP